MTLPASGPLSLSDIQTEFGGSNPISLNEYYAGGGLVPAGTSGTYGAVPTSGQISVQNFYGTSAIIPVYIEEIFSTYLYTGTGSAQTITNNIDLSANGGLVWIKGRMGTSNHMLWDSVSTASLSSNTTDASGNSGTFITSTSSSGFSINNNSRVSQSTYNFASWTFRKQPKFFDVVTYTGNGSARTIAHNLGSAPGCIMIKCLNDTFDWIVWHRSFAANNQNAFLNTTNAAGAYGVTSSTAPTDTVFSLTTSPYTNQNGSTYVAYLFAHNAGGFGATGSDNVISCGSFTTNGSGNATVNLGYEPQWAMVKTVNSAGTWWMMDTMRGWTANTGNNFQYLQAQSSSAEGAAGTTPINATGFTVAGNNFNSSDTYIYIAIRRGPMKVPTDATKVLQVSTTSTARLIGDIYDSNLNPPDLYIFQRLTPFGAWWSDRLRGWKLFSSRGSDGEEGASYVAQSGKQDELVYVGNWDSALAYANWYFRRAPGFFDTVCYTGTGVNRTVAHNLTVAPELLITKCRNGTSLWMVYDAAGGNTKRLILNGTNTYDVDISYWNNTTPTASVFTLGNSAELNASGSTYVAYLFATCAGVSKVGTYTGTGALQTVNCGFASGVRWVLIKRTDSTGGWYVYDSARGITSGNDPYLFLNNSDGEVTGTNYVDTTSVGFQVTAAAPAGLNANGGTYIFLAIA
jgi:hypothetical protein